MRAALLVLVAVAASGCLAGTAEPPTEALLADATAPPAAFSFTASDCEAGGFVMPYGGMEEGPAVLAEVWTTADIREEIGDPLHDGMMMPVMSELHGNWHIGIECASAEGPEGTVEAFELGWVGEMVEPPAWDEGGADLHFLLAGLAFPEDAIGEALRAATTADITHVEEVRLDWAAPRDAPRSALYARFVDRERGVYESYSTMQYYRDVPTRTLRFWWAVPVDGSEASSGHVHSTGEEHGTFHPVHFDMVVEGGAQYVTPRADAAQFSTHNMLGFEHGPAVGQSGVTNVYVHPALSFTTGKVHEDVRLHEVWTH